jgi:hypothetical protein
MNTDAFIAVLFAIGLLSAPKTTPELKALAMIETGNNGLRIGKAGEVSAYQIKPIVWKQQKSIPYNVHYWSRLDYASAVAMEHKLWLCHNYCKQSGYSNVNNLEFYCLWNMGLEGFRKYSFSVQAVPRKTRNAAMRYNNLVFLYSSNN